MSQHHQADSGHHGESSPVSLAIQVAIGTLALIIGIMLLASFAVSTRALGTDAKSMSQEETAKRIAPVAKLVVKGGEVTAAAVAPAPAVAKVASAPTAAAPAVIPAAMAPAKPDGKGVYTNACAVCHAQGVAGAPKLGDKAAWAPRIKGGLEALHASAIKGKGAMPAKGGNTALADADVRAAVEFMVAQSK